MPESLTNRDREVLSALRSREGTVIREWLAEVLVEHATTAPIGTDGAVDPNAIVFKSGQLSVLNKMRQTLAAMMILEGNNKQ